MFDMHSIRPLNGEYYQAQLIVFCFHCANCKEFSKLLTKKWICPSLRATCCQGLSLLFEVKQNIIENWYRLAPAYKHLMIY